METAIFKTCFKCRRDLPITEFYAHPQMADGYLGKCKECTRRDVTRNRVAKIGHARSYDRIRSKSPKRKAESAEKNRRMRSEKPGMSAAHNAVHRAVATGRLVRPSACQRCPSTERIQAHHDDHARPFDVMWLCPVCHAARHKELGRLRTVRTIGAFYGADIDLGI